MTEEKTSIAVPLSILLVVTLVAANVLCSGIIKTDREIKKREKQNER